MDNTQIEFKVDSLENRLETYWTWVREVREPARANTEGLREISSSQRSAVAYYEVALLPRGNWAIRMCCEYRCGDCSGRSIPWTQFDTREDCIDYFLKTARHHFKHTNDNARNRQSSAHAEMKALLADGLFGFLEPKPKLDNTNELNSVPSSSAG